MCLAVPMKIIEINEDRTGIAESGGVSRKINLKLLDDCAPGDYVIIHAGFAIEKLNEEQAAKSVALFDELVHEMSGIQGQSR
jgi:hydrogenase expression/formation protein HypC